MYLQDGNHIFNRNNLHLNPIQQQIYLEIQQQKDKYMFEENHRPSLGGCQNAAKQYTRPICSPNAESRHLADILGIDPEFGRDPFEDIVEEICAETRLWDGWVSEMIKNHALSIKRRTAKAKKDKEE